jgi:hypothetical protein
MASNKKSLQSFFAKIKDYRGVDLTKLSEDELIPVELWELSELKDLGRITLSIAQIQQYWTYLIGLEQLNEVIIRQRQSKKEEEDILPQELLKLAQISILDIGGTSIRALPDNICLYIILGRPLLLS